MKNILDTVRDRLPRDDLLPISKKSDEYYAEFLEDVKGEVERRHRELVIFPFPILLDVLRTDFFPPEALLWRIQVIVCIRAASDGA